MGIKGISQVDFAIASGMFLLLFAFLVLFSSDYFTTLKNDATITEKRSFDISLLNDLMTEGEPGNWDVSLNMLSKTSAANWSRCLNRTGNQTIEAFTGGELDYAGDANFSYVNSSQYANAIEAVFNKINIPLSASIGNVRFNVRYNASYFKKSENKNEWIDDMTVFISGSEEYIEDWGTGATSGNWVWWNSSDHASMLDSAQKLNNLTLRLYYDPDESGAVSYFDQINMTINYSYSSYYPKKLGLFSDSYYFEVLVENNVDDLPNENVTLNFTQIGYSDVDPNSVTVYDTYGNVIACNISSRILTFGASVQNTTSKWYKIWFSRNSTSNFSSAACNSTITGTDNLTVGNGGEQIYPVYPVKVLQYRKLLALNTTNYNIMKNLTDCAYDFQISIKNSAGNDIYTYGQEAPRKGDVNAVQRSIVYQNSSAGINNGKIIVYMW